MIVLGFDPGTRFTGWAVIETRGATPKPIASTYLAGGYIPSEGSAIDAILATHWPNVVAIEKIAGFAFASTAKRGGWQAVVAPLIASSSVAGMIAEAARRCARVVEMTARDARKIVCRRSNASDALVKSAVCALVYGVPTRTNVHVRDSIVVALGTAWHLGGKA